jgi:hypothetical protein
LIDQLNLAPGREFVNNRAPSAAHRHAVVSSLSLIDDVAELHHIDL